MLPIIIIDFNWLNLAIKHKFNKKLFVRILWGCSSKFWQGSLLKFWRLLDIMNVGRTTKYRSLFLLAWYQAPSIIKYQISHLLRAIHLLNSSKKSSTLLPPRKHKKLTTKLTTFLLEFNKCKALRNDLFGIWLKMAHYILTFDFYWWAADICLF